MSILSDRWIRNQCLQPKYRVRLPNGGVEYLGHKITDIEERRIKMQELMGVDKNDPFLASPDGAEAAGLKALTEMNVTAEDLGLEIFDLMSEKDLAEWKPMIEPFEPYQVREVDGKKVVSFGTSSYGYDVKLQKKFKIFTNVKNSLIDPLNHDDGCYVDFEGDYVIIPPNSYALGVTQEYFRIPKDVMVVCVGKSTYARLAGLVNVTPIEPGFEGQVVIEIANGSTLPLKVYADQGIAQFMFFKGNEPAEVPYDKDRKYFGQTGITTARV